MSTAVADNANEIDPPAKPANGDAGDEEEDEAPEAAKEFKFYCERENMHEILQKRWGLFFLLHSVVYSYHFLSIIIGMDKYVHYSRFTGCAGTVDFKGASEVFDGALLIVLIFHIIEWIRQTVMLTTILVGVKWLLVYNLLSLNLLFGLVACIIGFATGFGADASCTEAQPGRALFLQLQLLTFFLFPLWNQLPILVFKLGDLSPCLKPTDEDSKGRLMYTTWTQKQFEFEEEEDDDD